MEQHIMHCILFDVFFLRIPKSTILPNNRCDKQIIQQIASDEGMWSDIMFNMKIISVNMKSKIDTIQALKSTLTHKVYARLLQ